MKNTVIRKNVYDRGLRPYYSVLRMMSSMFTKSWGVYTIHSLMKMLKGKNIKGLKNEERFIPSKNGAPDIRVRIFRPNTDEKLPAMLYNHGGGYMVGVPEVFLEGIQKYINKRPCVIVAPDYRKSVKHPYPAAFNDCYDTLLWMKENAESLNIQSSKFMIGGHSAGGGLTAAVTLKACDTGDVDIAFQMPIYPMIDHRQATESAKFMTGAPAWDTKNNAYGWNLYLRDIKGEIPSYASPALSEKYDHLPPTITFVGDYEPFKDETINYVENLKKNNVPVVFKLFKGAFHAFEMAKNTSIAKEADKFLYETYALYYDKYVLAKI